MAERTDARYVERWWHGDPEERYWLDATTRDEIGRTIEGPFFDESGKWRHPTCGIADAADWSHRRRGCISSDGGIGGLCLVAGGRSSDGWVAIASRRGSLLAVPDRVALFQERGHTLLRVVRERVVGHDQLAVLVGIVLGAIDLGVESALSRSNRVCA